MKKALILIILILAMVTGCVDLQLNTGSYGTSVGVGFKSKDGNVSWSQNVDISPRN